MYGGYSKPRRLSPGIPHDQSAGQFTDMVDSHGKGLERQSSGDNSSQYSGFSTAYRPVDSVKEEE
jgi:hypothetical protein